jgi:hypothetical protein
MIDRAPCDDASFAVAELGSLGIRYHLSLIHTNRCWAVRGRTAAQINFVGPPPSDQLF